MGTRKVLCLFSSTEIAKQTKHNQKARLKKKRFLASSPWLGTSELINLLSERVIHKCVSKCAQSVGKSASLYSLGRGIQDVFGGGPCSRIRCEYERKKRLWLETLSGSALV